MDTCDFIIQLYISDDAQYIRQYRPSREHNIAKKLSKPKYANLARFKYVFRVVSMGIENLRKNNKIVFQFYITKKKSIEMTLINNKNVLCIYDINTEHI